MGTCRRNWTFSAVFFSCSSPGEVCETEQEGGLRRGMARLLLSACLTRAAGRLSKALMS